MNLPPYQKKIFRGNTSAIELRLDDFFVSIEGIVYFFRRNDRLHRKVLMWGERLANTEIIEMGNNTLILATYHVAYTLGLIQYIIERFG